MEKFENIKLCSEVVYQLNEDGMMIYVPEEGMVHAINLTAADMVLAIDKGCNEIKGLMEMLMEKFVNVSEKELSKDVKDILNSMEKLKIVQGD